MAKLYVISDVHGYFDEMISALNEAGFDSNDENSWLIVCGDTTDRGPKPKEVIDYLNSLTRCVLIKGNHEQLLMDCIERQYPLRHDWSNGTAQTIIDLAPHAKTFEEACMVAYEIMKPFVDKMVNYFESERFVFCHGFLPVNCDDDLPAYYRHNRKFSKMEDWRNAHQGQWNDAMWLNSFDMIDMGFDIEKCVVAGHWHASYGRHKTNGEPEFGDSANFNAFCYNDTLIMIDACTVYSHKVNCLTLEDVLLDG